MLSNSEIETQSTKPRRLGGLHQFRNVVSRRSTYILGPFLAQIVTTSSKQQLGTYARIRMMSDRTPPVGPFSDNPVMIGYDSKLFESDPDLGFSFPGREIVGRHSFVDLEGKIADFKKRPPRFIVLNIGDSATSGWNSDLVYKGCRKHTAGLFSYRTYADLLEEKHNVGIINAGVPGYSTYQAKKYAAIILKMLAENGLYADYVTTHLGNNDCTFNGLEDKTRIDFRASSQGEILTRVSREDFRRNYEELLDTICAYGATPIVLVPASNLKWQPGLRSKKYPGELELQRGEIAHTRISKRFEDAERAYQSGDYETALESDLFLPRIKAAYKRELLALARLAYVIDVQDLVKSQEDFLDYCHPGELLNGRIAEAVSNFFVRKNSAYKGGHIDQEFPSDTYTLY